MAGKRGRKKVKATISMAKTTTLKTRAVANVAVEALEEELMSGEPPAIVTEVGAKSGS